jgi:hypothetical protein
LLWIPIAAVIVCGTIERGLWWWGEDDGWVHQQQETGLKKSGANMMSEEEFDLKIGLGKGRGGGGNNRRNGSQGRLSYYADEEEEAMESRPAFVTPIASQFRTSADEEGGFQGGTGDIGQTAPSSYRQHHQRRQLQHQQQQRQQSQEQVAEEQTPRSIGRGGGRTGGDGLVRKGSTNSMTPSISARLSTFFGQGWNSGPMPPPPAPEASPPTRPSPAHHRPIRHDTASDKQDDANGDGASEPDKTSLHGVAYTTQWHNRRYDDWS